MKSGESRMSCLIYIIRKLNSLNNRFQQAIHNGPTVDLSSCNGVNCRCQDTSAMVHEDAEKGQNNSCLWLSLPALCDCVYAYKVPVRKRSSMLLTVDTASFCSTGKCLDNLVWELTDGNLNCQQKCPAPCR